MLFLAPKGVFPGVTRQVALHCCRELPFYKMSNIECKSLRLKVQYTHQIEMVAVPPALTNISARPSSTSSRLVSVIISGTTTPSKDRSFVFRSQDAIIFITCAPRYRSPCLYLPKIYRLNIGLPPLINDATGDTENGA